MYLQHILTYVCLIYDSHFRNAGREHALSRYPCR